MNTRLGTLTLAGTRADSPTAKSSIVTLPAAAARKRAMGIKASTVKVQIARKATG